MSTNVKEKKIRFAVNPIPKNQILWEIKFSNNLIKVAPETFKIIKEKFVENHPLSHSELNEVKKYLIKEISKRKLRPLNFKEIILSANLKTLREYLQELKESKKFKKNPLI